MSFIPNIWQHNETDLKRSLLASVQIAIGPVSQVGKWILATRPKRLKNFTKINSFKKTWAVFQIG